MSTNNYSLVNNNNNINDNFCRQIAGGFHDPKCRELDFTSIFFSAAPGLLNRPDLGLLLAGTSRHVVREESADISNPAARHLTFATWRLPSRPSLDFYRSLCSKPEVESSVDDRDQQRPSSGSSETRSVNLSRTHPSPLTFSIERILRQDFGARRNNSSCSVCRNIEEQPSTIGGTSQRCPAAATSGCQSTGRVSRQQEQEQEISSSSSSNFSWTVDGDDFQHQQNSSSSRSSRHSTGSISPSRLLSANLSASVSDDPSYHARTTGSGNTSPAAAAAADPRLPAWIYCTRYSDRPCAGQRTRKKKTQQQKQQQQQRRRPTAERPRTRTAFHSGQLAQLTAEFDACRYLTDERRLRLASQLDLHESQIKVWFQNRRAKLKKARRAFHSGN